MLNGLDLFSGIGGITLALSEWVKPIAYCERDRYAQSVLLSRMSDGELPRAPIWIDVASLTGGMLPSGIDIIYGGFPCQDISVAGNGIGLGGERSGLFFHIARLVEETNPRFIFLENVPAIRTRGLNSIVQTLTYLGYDCRWTIVSAAEIGAPHIRKRWFLLAHSRRFGMEGLEHEKRTRSSHRKNFYSYLSKNWKDDLRKFPRKDNGLPVPMDRIKGLGNAVVPLQAKIAFERLMGLEQLKHLK
jgi:DNA (cytosine-5)-methyltransferase 1